MIKNIVLKLSAKYKLLFGFCPKCNSDAPELYDCEVCGGYHSARGDKYPPTKQIKTKWWSKYIKLLEQNND